MNNWEEEFDNKFPTHGFNNNSENEFHSTLLKKFIKDLLEKKTTN